MDVHPPLAKLLLTLAGWLAGFDGNFDFKDIGKDYLEPGVPYVAMRLLPAVCGILLVPTMFLTLKAVGCRTMTAFMGACLIIFGKSLWSGMVGWVSLTFFREWSSNPSTTDPPRFSAHDYDSVHRIVMDILYESTGAGPIQGVPTNMVVLACYDRSRVRGYS